jgi:hypothetical protein
MFSKVFASKEAHRNAELLFCTMVLLQYEPETLTFIISVTCGQSAFQNPTGKLNGLGDFFKFSLPILRMRPAATFRRPQEVRSHQNVCRRVLAPVFQQVVEVP